MSPETQQQLVTVRGMPMAWQTAPAPALDCTKPGRQVLQDEPVTVIRKGKVGRVICKTADGFVFWTDADRLSAATSMPTAG